METKNVLKVLAILVAVIIQPVLSKAQLSVSITSYTNVTCHGQSTGSATATESSGTAPFTYSWSNGTTSTSSSPTNTLSGLSSASYTVKVTSGGISATATVSITQPAALGVTASATIEVLCSGANTGSATATATNGTSPYAYSWSKGGGTTSTASGLSAATYTVTVQDNCSATASVKVTITQPTALGVTTVATTEVLCTGASTGNAKVNASHGTSPYTYSWSNGTTTSSTGAVLSAATYTVTVQDNCSATVSALVTITQPYPLDDSIVTASTINVSCTGASTGSATVGVKYGTSPYTYSWSNGISTVSTSDPTGAILAAGSYTVTVTDNCSATATASVTIQTNPQLTSVNVAATPGSACNNGTTGGATATPVGGATPYTYSWSSGSTTSSTGVVTVPRSYTVTVQDNCGTSVTASIAIQQSPAITATTSVTSTVLCYGASTGGANVSVTGGVIPYTYLWTPLEGTNSSITSYLATQTFSYQAAIQTFTIPTGVTQISITVTGGAGGLGAAPAIDFGGTGASFTAVVSALTPGHVLGIVAGGMGGPGTGLGGAGGGGGASYIWDENTTTLFAVAGGGGGAAWEMTEGTSGAGGTNLTTNATTYGSGGSSNTLTGGTGGSGGTSGVSSSTAYDGASGAGWLSNGGSISGPDPATGGYSSTGNGSNNFEGGAGFKPSDAGGYGGGGGGGYTDGGGGGGYNGGGGGAGGTTEGGGGGGSYFNTAYGGWPATVTATNTGNGSVTLNYIQNTGVPGGTYTVTVTDANGCSQTASVLIAQPGILSATASVRNITCNSASNGIATANISGGTSPYTYSWSGGSRTNSSVSGLNVGAYTVTVQDNCSASSTASVTINQPSTLSVTPSVMVNVVCNGASTGIVSELASGGTAPYTYSWNPNQGTPGTVVGPVTTTTFSYEAAIQNFTVPSGVTQITMTVTGAQGGEGVATLNATGGAGAGFTAIASVTQSHVLSVVVGQAGGTSSPTRVGGGGGASWVYDSSITGVHTATVTPTLSGLIAVAAGGGGGSYLTIANGGPGYGGAGGTDLTGNSTTNGVGEEPSGNSAPGGTNGSGGSGGLAYGGGASTSGGAGGAGWVSNGETDDSPTDLGGNDWASTSPFASATGYDASTGGFGGGGGGNVSGAGGGGGYNGGGGGLLNVGGASGGGGGSYFNTAYGSLPGTVTATNTGNGSVSIAYQATLVSQALLPANGYTVTVSDNNGCNATANVSITQPNPLSATIFDLSNACGGANSGVVSANPTGGTSPYTYSWGGGLGTNPIVSGLSAGNYNVTIRDNCGGSATASLTIAKSTSMALTTVYSNPITCYGFSNGLAKVGVTGGAAPYTFSWSNGSNIYLASSLSTGTYSVTVNDKNGCTSTASISITQPTLLVANMTSIIAPTCNTTGSATIGASGGTSPYGYEWAPNSTNTTATATGLVVRTYTVQVKDNKGCINGFSFSITQPPILHDSIVTGATGNTTCAENNGRVTVGVKYGVPPYTYTWNPTASSSATASGLSAGTYTITVNDAGSCSATTSVKIGTSTAVTAVALVGNVITCNGASNGLVKAGGSGGTAPYTFSWSNGSNIYIASSLSTGTYSVTVIDKNQCLGTASVSISQPTVLKDSVASLSEAPCTGGTGSATIGVTGGTSPYRYQWNPNVSTTATAVGLTVRSYSVLVKDNNGCQSEIHFSDSCTREETLEAPQSTTTSPGADNINLYPNPNTGQFTLSDLQKDMTVQVYDYTGKEISTISTTGETMQLNIFNQADGIYLVRILDRDGNLASQKKVVKTQ